MTAVAAFDATLRAWLTRKLDEQPSTPNTSYGIAD
jgi:hypothetical protein